GILQQVDEDFKDIVEIALQTGPMDGGRVDTATRLDTSSPLFQVVVELVTGLGFRPAGSPYFAIDIHQTRLFNRDRTTAAANSCNSVDERELVILLQKNHHTVRQHNALRLRRVKGGQRRDRNIFPGGRLSPKLDAAANHDQSQQSNESALH